MCCASIVKIGPQERSWATEFLFRGMMGVTPLLEVSHTSLPRLSLYEVCAKVEEKCLSIEHVIQLKMSFPF